MGAQTGNFARCPWKIFFVNGKVIWNHFEKNCMNGVVAKWQTSTTQLHSNQLIVSAVKSKFSTFVYWFMLYLYLCVPTTHLSDDCHKIIFSPIVPFTKD